MRAGCYRHPSNLPPACSRARQLSDAVLLPRSSNIVVQSKYKSCTLRAYVKRMTHASQLPEVKPAALDLLERLLLFDPKKRISAMDAIAVSAQRLVGRSQGLSCFTTAWPGSAGWTRVRKRCTARLGCTSVSVCRTHVTPASTRSRYRCAASAAQAVGCCGCRCGPRCCVGWCPGVTPPGCAAPRAAQLVLVVIWRRRSSLPRESVR